MAPGTPPPPKLVFVPARATPRLRLFVCPHAGTGTAPYRPFAKTLPPSVELAIAELPGRDSTFGAPTHQTMRPLVSALAPVILPHLDMPFALFGHSFGAHVAFELARVLRESGAPSPKCFIASGSRAPHLRLRREPLHALPKARFIEELRRYGGTPEAVLKNDELMDLFLPPLRADLGIYETHSAAPGEPLAIPITAWGGRNDHTLLAEDIEAWREHTSGAFTSRTFEGGHFYLFEQARPLFTQALGEVLERLA